MSFLDTLEQDAYLRGLRDAVKAMCPMCLEGRMTNPTGQAEAFVKEPWKPGIWMWEHEGEGTVSDQRCRAGFIHDLIRKAEEQT